MNNEPVKFHETDKYGLKLVRPAYSSRCHFKADGQTAALCGKVPPRRANTGWYLVPKNRGKVLLCEDCIHFYPERYEALAVNDC